MVRRFADLILSFQGTSAALTRRTGETGLVKRAFVAIALVVHSGNVKCQAPKDSELIRVVTCNEEPVLGYLLNEFYICSDLFDLISSFNSR
jgi:hypothetical protein